MSERQTRREAIAAWWCAEIRARDRESGRARDRETARARALSARLRRAEGVEALAEPAVQALARRLGLGPADAGRLVRLVQALAEVRTATAEPLARRLGGPEPALSPLRFQRLLRARDEELAVQLRRALAMAERRCDPGALGRDLLDWEHPERGDRVRADWCFAYFGAPAEAAADPASPEETPA